MRLPAHHVVFCCLCTGRCLLLFFYGARGCSSCRLGNLLLGFRIDIAFFVLCQIGQIDNYLAVCIINSLVIEGLGNQAVGFTPDDEMSIPAGR